MILSSTVDIKISEEPADSIFRLEGDLAFSVMVCLPASQIAFNNLISHYTARNTDIYILFCRDFSDFSRIADVMDIIVGGIRKILGGGILLMDPICKFCETAVNNRLMFSLINSECVIV
jgi:hypothetical protein